MSYSSDSLSLYETLMTSIFTFDEVPKKNIKDKASMVAIADKIINGEVGILKFIQVKSQMESYLDVYDFRGVFQKEDNVRQTNTLRQLLDDNETKQIDLQELNNIISNAVRKRLDDIKEIVKKYPWLERKNYKDFHNALLSRYISFSEYESSIDAARKERNKKIWKGIGLAIGIPIAIAVLIYGIAIILGILVVGFIFRMVFSSSNSD